MKRLRHVRYAHKSIVGLIIGALLVDLIGGFVTTGLFNMNAAQAAVVTVDSTASGTARSHNFLGAATVFISDTTGYIFYRDSNGQCVYSKSTDSGDTWGSSVVVDSQTDCIRTVVWYDQWTPGDSGSNIHIATMDTSEDALFYNRLDTTSDTLLLGSSPVNATANSGQVPTFSVAVNTNAITKATDGKIYLASNDNSDAYVVSCSVSCQTQTNWTEVGTSPLDNRNDHNVLMPLAGGDVMIINRDISANDIRTKVWDGISWDASWTVVDGNADESTEYDGGMSATLDVADNNIYLAYATDNASLIDNDDDIRTAVYDGTDWTVMADVLTNVTGRGLIDVAIALDQNNSDIYVAYTIQDTGGTSNTGNIYYKESTDGMTSWGSEIGPVNTTPGDIRKPALDPNNADRLYVSWWDSVNNDQFGETLANIGPDSTLTTTGTQRSIIRSGSSDIYLEADFVINSLTANSVTSITLTQNGTVDGTTGLDNIKLFYDLDTSAPYDCASESYNGTESQFGSTDTDGFSASGTSTFSGSVIGVGPSQALCLYTVLDVTDAVTDGATLEIEIADPPTDIIVSGSDMSPTTAVALPGTSSIVSPQLTQTGYHWRNDDGSEAAATSATGGNENTPLSALSSLSPKRLRVAVSVEGSTSTEPINYQLEYAAAAPTCAEATLWTGVDAVDDAFNMSPSTNLTDEADTTNIAVSTGGVNDANVTFLSPNGAVQDIGDITSAITLETDEFLELEFSVVASSSAVEGETYCFRVSNAGADIGVYDVYPRATINAEVSVNSFGTQIVNTDIPTTDVYSGGGFSIRENDTSHSVTSITLTQNGTVDGTTGLDNIKLFYDLDTSAPYDCASESYNGTESQFGSTDTDGFSASGTSTFSGSSVLITTSQTMCIYPVFDVTSNASNGDTVEISIESANSDVIAGSASVSPSNPRTIDGTTTLLGAVMTQTGYHWRNDDGSEAAATSATGGSEDTDVTDFQIDTPIRLRLGLSNEGATSSVESVYQLEFAERVTTCSAISSWSAVDAEASDDWDAFNSTNLTQGADTTNIAVSAGGVTDQNTAFLTPNAGVRKTGASSASTTITETEFTELEFSLTSTVATTFGATYCFRLTANGAPLDAYTTYPEITTADKRDFKVQRGNIVLTDTTGTITAGIDYTAPASSSTAFIRITNTNNTGAGDIVGGGAQDVEETTVYIQNPGTIETSVTFARDRNLNESFVDWEIIEFIAQPDTDNEMIVRDVGTATMSAVQTSINTPSTTVEDDADVVVFITGVSGDDVGNDFYSTQVTAEWDSINNRPVFTREATGGAAVDVSYAVVEYTGINWSVQRVEHTYTAAGTIETESITPVASLNQAFIHAQKRVGANTFVASFGHEVYLSSIGAVSFSLDSNADMAVTHVSVAWVIENTQTGAGAMQVERQSGDTQGGVEPSTQSIAIANTLAALDNSSIFGNSAAAGTNNAHPRAIAGLRLTSDTRYELWRSDTGARLYYRTEIVQWPVADLSVRQNYYRIYTDNNLLTPDDPWPAGATDLGENTSITATDNPPGIGEVMRLRMTLRAKNANWPADFYQFKLQYAERVSTCTAVGSWTDVGAAGSGEIWRGFAATGTTDGTDLSGDPPTPGDLLISVSDVAGKLVHQNLSATNTYIAFDGEDVEYDWYLQHNGALADTTYCFRAVETDGTALSGYLQYPQIRTADFTPRLTNWRWYDDAINETPSSPAAALDVAPNEIAASSSLMLRVVVDEQKSVNGQDVKFRLQFSEDITFTNPIDVAATSACPFDATWCFFDGGGTDNATITTAVTGVSDSCVAATGAGCGTQNSSSVYAPGHQHPAQAAQEYSFMVQSTALRAGAVYYFRLFDIASAKPVELSSGASYPAAVGESAGLVFTIQGLSSGTATAGVVTDVTTTATEVNFGVLPVGSDTIAAQRLLIDTNAIEGYQVLKFAGQNLTNGSGVEIANISSSNAVPQGWATACSIVAAGCVGYHTTDATLFGGSARFAATDTYSALHSSVEEIMYSSLPATESHDVVYRVRVTEQQPAGDYSTNIVYIATPVF